MARNHRHIQIHEKEMLELKEQGISRNDVFRIITDAKYKSITNIGNTIEKQTAT